MLGPKICQMLVPSHRGQTWGEGTLLQVTSPPSVPILMEGQVSSASPVSSLSLHAAPCFIEGTCSHANRSHAQQDSLSAPPAAARHWGDRITNVAVALHHMAARSDAPGLASHARTGLLANALPSSIPLPMGGGQHLVPHLCPASACAGPLVSWGVPVPTPTAVKPAKTPFPRPQPRHVTGGTASQMRLSPRTT